MDLAHLEVPGDIIGESEVLMPDTVTLKINNREVRIAEPGDTTLAQYLRDVERLAGVRIACDEAACGACTVLAGRRVISPT